MSNTPSLPPLWLHPKLQALPFTLPGPFALTGDGQLVTVSPDNRGVSFSRDEGLTWRHAPLRPYGPSDQEFKISNERVLLRTRSGTLILSFMNLNEKRWLWRDALKDALPGNRLPHYVTRSTDDGQTWSAPLMLHEEWTGEIRNIIQLRSGRLLLSSMKFQHHPGRHTVLTYHSDDDGVSWQPSHLIDLGGNGHHGGVTEATVEELHDGSVLMLIRTNWGEFWRAISHDGGASWRDQRPSGISASSAPGLLKRLASGRLLLLWNQRLPEGASSFPLRGGDGLWSEVPVSNHREELSLAWYDEHTHTISPPVIIARQAGANISYPRLLERQPGELWLTQLYLGGSPKLCLRLLERDFS